jgi:hypothetical protein
MTDTENTASTESKKGWSGWGTFAGVVLIIAGALDALHGLQAIIGPNTVYFIAKSGLFQINVAGWGWWHLILGLAVLFAGISLLGGAKWARVVAIIIVAINAIGQLTLIDVQPWLSIAVLGLDVVVIYALTVHGKEIDKA